MEFLVARGHAIDAVIFNYSLRKINALYGTAIKNHQHEMKMLGIAVRQGTNASAKEFTAWLKRE